MPKKREKKPFLKKGAKRRASARSRVQKKLSKTLKKVNKRQENNSKKKTIKPKKSFVAEYHEPEDIDHGTFAFYKNLPHGIKTLLIYSIILALFYMFYFFIGLFNPKAVFVGGLFSGYGVLFLDFLIVVFLAFVIHGLVNRTAWGWTVTILFYATSIVGSILSIFMINAESFEFIRELLILSSIFIILIDGLIIWYVYVQRSYFVPKPPREKYTLKDKIFVYTLVSFWVILIFLSLTIGIQFYQNTTEIADEMVLELRGASIMHAFLICEEEEGQSKDICYVVLATMFSDQDLRTVCSRVDSDFYRLTCLQIR